eukprot:6183190-Pleurochrysis_carterae.AAC.1
MAKPSHTLNLICCACTSLHLLLSPFPAAREAVVDCVQQPPSGTEGACQVGRKGCAKWDGRGGSRGLAFYRRSVFSRLIDSSCFESISCQSSVRPQLSVAWQASLAGGEAAQARKSRYLCVDASFSSLVCMSSIDRCQASTSSSDLVYGEKLEGKSDIIMASATCGTYTKTSRVAQSGRRGSYELLIELAEHATEIAACYSRSLRFSLLQKRCMCPHTHTYAPSSAVGSALAHAQSYTHSYTHASAAPVLLTAPVALTSAFRPNWRPNTQNARFSSPDANNARAGDIPRTFTRITSFLDRPRDLGTACLIKI